VTTAPGIPDALLEMFAENQRQRDRRTAALWFALTERERALVREAAVMAYVHGGMSKPGPAPDPFPRDMAIVATVLEAVQSFEDRYPTLSRYVPTDDDTEETTP
jgi:hypothetical protein